MSDKEQHDLKKLYEMNPELYHRSEAEKKKYGSERLQRLNQETLKEVIQHNEKRKQELKSLGDKIAEEIKTEAIKFLKKKSFYLGN